MRPSDLWPKRARIIEVGATCGAVGERLVAANYDNYLAVTSSDQRRKSIGRKWPALAGRVIVALPLNDIRQNNAEVLVLDGWAALAMGRFRSIRHAQYVATKLQFAPLCWIAILLALLQCLIYRFAWPRFVDCGRYNGGPWLVAFRVRNPRPYEGVRRFIPHSMGIAGFLRQVRASGARHAVLRWFENLPQLPPGEDLDLLVDDASLEMVRSLLDSGSGIQPVDMYSVTGLPGADFRSMPYLPPYLADQLLDRAVPHHCLCNIPAKREHFLSLAYHALYHKGFSSGIPANARVKPSRASAGHDYVAILKRLANELGINVAISLESLDAYLDSQGWRPPHDMLIRLSRRNRWVRALLTRRDQGSATDDRIAVFLVRAEALQRGGVALAARLIEEHGFRVLLTKDFDDQLVPVFARSLRGGNWGRGPWPISGGPPVAAIVAFDPAPIVPTRKQKKRFPFLSNARLLCKEQLRDAYNEGIEKQQHCNVIHSSDNGREALDYLRIIMPESVEDLLSMVQPRRIAARAA